MSKRIRNALSAVFGTLHWKTPSWLTSLRQKSHASPKKFWGASVLSGLIIAVAAFALYQYQHMPRPIYTTALITAPAITPNEETLAPANLVLDFGVRDNGFINKSVAPLNQVGKAVTEGLEISPKIPGTWVWTTDSQLTFTPAEDWPAGQHYTIHFLPDFFAATANMESFKYSFSTQPFTAKITEFKLYQDPVHAEVRKAVATIAFNFPVNTKSLEQNTTLQYQAQGKNAAENQSFSYTYDAHKRVAYLHSDSIQIKDSTRFLILTLNKEIQSATGSATLQQTQTDKLLIPDAHSFLKVLSASAAIVRDAQDRPEQILSVETSLGINETEFNKSVHFYILPKDRPATAAAPEQKNYTWQNPGEVTQEILALSRPLTKEAIPGEYNYSTIHSFKFSAPAQEYIYVTIDKGMQSFGGFSLSNQYAAVIPVPALPKEISFLHKGSLLALSSEKKLSVLVRGVPAVKFDFARVLPENVNQLVTQTQGDFNNPLFINPTFNQQNISQISSEVQQFDTSDLAKQHYTALDFSKYLTMEAYAAGPQGLFLLQATGWDVNNQVALDVKASRLILITDLAMLVKDNSDGSHDVFVDSITQGAPVAQATVLVLGKNGIPILSRVTDEQGRAHFPPLKDFVADREPTVYLAQLNNDISFIPFNNSTRQLNFSKFDIGGVYTNAYQDMQSLSAYLFSDRGIYRPGDTVHIGMIIKQAYAQAQPAGLPLQISVLDPRGTTIKEQKITLNDTGYMDFDFTPSATAPTGQYTVNLLLVKDEHAQNLLGSTNIRVSEFQPDRMRITTTLSPKPALGWSNPLGLKGEVNLWNLYGAPAVHRTISSKLLLVPQKIAFDHYPDYVFADPLTDPQKSAKVFTESLTDTTTNDQGKAEFNLQLERFEKATYQLTFFAEGFEADGGRSVTGQAKALISPLPYFIGYKADGDLSFIKQESTRSVHFIAVNPELNQINVPDLKMQLVSLHPVTTLVKKPDGTYQYQSVTHSTILNTIPFTIDKNGSSYTLPTNQIGDFSLNVLGTDNSVLSQLKFTIVGASQQPLAKNAELSIKLNKAEYQAGEDIEIQITAPYTGSGLITIERDKVHAAQWFKTDTTSSVQTIHIPADFQGNGYINVAFIRDWNSPEIFISPLSYSIAPFAVNHDNHNIKIDLKTAEVSRPGEPLTIDYHTDKAGKIIVFAVDEGILQVARYTTPDPLAFFFQKHALEVLTQQTVDQIMPQFILQRELSAVGGDSGEEGMASRLNPFKRKTDLPVAFWSGIIDTDTTTRQLTYQVPEYFNGTLRIMAVAVSSDSVGSQETTAAIRGDFIINPNVPTFVAPGDTFEISSSVANNLKGSGANASVTVTLTASPELELISPPAQTLNIAEGTEHTAHFTLKAKSKLGAAALHFKAAIGDKSGAMSSTVSIRPAMPMMTFINSGRSQETQKTLDISQGFYPEHHKISATISTSPMILVFGLQRYMDNYPYGCTEQLTSKVMPLLAMNSQTGFADETKEIKNKIDATIQMLGQRQMSNGGFSYWPGLGDNQGNDFASVYAMQFLTEAKAQGFDVPDALFFNGINYLKTLAGQESSDLNTARIQANAIYLLTRNEIVTTNYITNLQLYLENKYAKQWKHDIAAVYLAGAYQLLQSHEEANRLIGQYTPQTDLISDTDFYDRNIADAQYLYIVAKHFPNLLPQVSDSVLMRLIHAINNNEINTILSGYTSLALGAYPQDKSIGSSNLSMTKILADKQNSPIPVSDSNYQKVALEANTTKIRFENPNKQTFFYQLNQSGFSTILPQEPQKHGLEIFREYKNAQGNPVTSVTLGAELQVHINIRTLDSDYLTNIAIEDLLPGGFEVVNNSVTASEIDYFDIREDRVNFFGGAGTNVKTIVYTIKATNTGTYTVPPAYAESMYDPNTYAQGVASTITVTSTK